MRLTEQEEKLDFFEMKETLEDIDIESEYHNEDGVFERRGLLMYLPDESDKALATEDDKFHIAVCYLYEMDEDDEQINKYYLIYSEIDEDVEKLKDLGELAVYRALTDFNKKVSTGYFYLEVTEENKWKICYKTTLIQPMGEVIDKGIIGETLIQITFYLSVMEDYLDDLLSGE